MVQSTLLTAVKEPPQRNFSDNFWGDKINGFDVLCQNLKHSLTSVKDLETFLRETANCEDTYVKVLNKLVSQINRFSVHGSFNPLWLPLKELNEKYAGKHVEQLQHLHELIKEIQRYNDELSKKIKRIRENELQTQNVVQTFQEISQTLNKTKEQYHNLCIEFEKQKRLLDPQQLTQYQQQLPQQQVSSSNLLTSITNPNLVNNSICSGSVSSVSGLLPTNCAQAPLLNQGLPGSNNASNNATTANGTNNVGVSTGLVTQTSSGTTSDRLSSLASSISVSKVSQVQKLEKKLKLAFEDYKASIDKYNIVRDEFERKLADSCNNFQFAEETHLKQMRVFIESYSILLANINASKQQIYAEFQAKFEKYTSDYLLQVFIENKRTGTERPEAALFVDQCDYAKSTIALLNQVNQAPTPVPLINETDFNLFINGGNFTNTSLNSSSALTPSSSSNILPTQATGQSNSLQPPLLGMINSANNNGDLIDGRGGEFSSTRGTPIFFNSANNGPYSPLTNATSISALNTIPAQAALNPMIIASNNLGNFLTN